MAARRMTTFDVIPVCRDVRHSFRSPPPIQLHLNWIQLIHRHCQILRNCLAYSLCKSNIWELILKVCICNVVFLKNLPRYLLYRSCIALFYRKRLPQQNGDRWIGERETSMHLIVCGSEVGTRALPSPPTCDNRRACCTMTAPPSIVHKQAKFSDF